jgi:hypothetical protein
MSIESANDQQWDAPRNTKPGQQNAGVPDIWFISCIDYKIGICWDERLNHCRCSKRLSLGSHLNRAELRPQTLRHDCCLVCGGISIGKIEECMTGYVSRLYPVVIDDDKSPEAEAH